MMKITDSNPITIRGRSNILDVLRQLSPGNKITARIIERTGINRALIEIEGRRLDAEFTKGVPPGNYLSLVLQRRSGHSMVFMLAGDDVRLEHLQKLNSYLVFDTKLISPEVLYNLAGRLKNGLSGIFVLNLYMMGMKDPEKNAGSGPAELLNRLLSLGIKNEQLVFFSYLFSSRGGIILNYLMPFLKFLGDGKKSGPYDELMKLVHHSGGPEELTKELETLFRQSGPDEGALLKELLEELISGGFTGNADTFYGSIPYFDEKFRDVHYIVCGNSIAVSVEFSFLGRLDILAKDTGGTLALSVFCDNKNAAAHLNKDIKEILGILNRVSGKKVEIRISMNRRAMENVIEINTLLMKEGMFNIKV